MENHVVNSLMSLIIQALGKILQRWKFNCKLLVVFVKRGIRLYYQIHIAAFKTEIKTVNIILFHLPVMPTMLHLKFSAAFHASPALDRKLKL